MISLLKGRVSRLASVFKQLYNLEHEKEKLELWESHIAGMSSRAFTPAPGLSELLWGQKDAKHLTIGES